QKAGPRVVDHVVAVGGAVRRRQIGPPGERLQVVDDRLDAGLGRIPALGPAAVVYVPGVGRALLVGVGDLRRPRLARGARHRLPGDRVTGAEHDVLHAGPPHDRLVVVVAHGVLVGQPLEHGCVATQHVVEAHGVAPRVVTTGDADVRVEIVQASGGAL